MMDRRILVGLLCLGLLPSVAAQNTDPVITDPIDVEFAVGAGEITKIDLLEDADKTVWFTVHAHDNDVGDRVAAVEITMVMENGIRFSLNPIDNGDGSWSASLAVAAHPEDLRAPVLLKGEWSAIVKVYDRFGGVSQATTSKLFDVTATSASQHLLVLEPFDLSTSSGVFERVELGVNDVLRFNASVQAAPHLVRSVSYHIDDGETISVPAPYVLPESDFPEGLHELHVSLTDRAGRSTSVHGPVYKDTTVPVAVVAPPAVVYQGVPFDVSVIVEDASAHTVFFNLEDNVTKIPSTDGELLASGAYLYSTEMVRPELGNSSLLVSVVDALDNVVRIQRTLTAIEAVTDTTGRVDVAEAFLLPGTPVVFDIEVEQIEGVTQLPIEAVLTIPGVGEVFRQTVDVPVGGIEFLEAMASLPPGRYEANLTIDAGPVNETDASDQTDLVSFEVFVGKVIVKATGTEYYIRVDDRRLPIEAVSTGGASYALRLNQTSGDVLYQFDVGDATYSWNADERITTVPEPEKPKDNESPAWSMPLLALALLALAARRRR